MTTPRLTVTATRVTDEQLQRFSRDGGEAWMEAIEDMADELIERRAALPAWAPIATAPRDQIILLFAVVDTETGNWKKGAGYLTSHHGKDVWTWDGRRLCATETKPTHWMPMPEAPPLEDAP